MRAFFRELWTRLYRAYERSRRREAELYLAELDARTIEDIGLEPWRSPLGAELERRRQITRRGYPRAY